MPEARLPALDGLRGLAVMGILLMNIVGFALPDGAYFNPLAVGGSMADRIAWALMALLVDGKMRALFSLLFGASMLLVIDGAEDGLQRHYRRMAALLPFGLAHAWLIWWGDILTHYAFIGMAAALFAYHDTRALVRAALVCFAVQALIGLSVVAGVWQLRAMALAPDATAAAVTAWADLRAAIGIATPDRLAAEIAVYRGPYAGLVHELAVARRWDQVTLLWSGGAETLGLMLLGMAGLRSGFLTGGWPRAAYARVAAWGYALGLAGTAPALWIDMASGFDTATVFTAAYLGGLPFRPILAGAHAALALLWLTGGRGGLRARVTAAGRVAFTNYLGTSLLMAALFYGWGIGLYAMVPRAGLYLIVPVVWAAMLAWSRPWLARHPYGPLEWAWRSLARGAVQPWRSAGADR